MKMTMKWKVFHYISKFIFKFFILLLNEALNIYFFKIKKKSIQDELAPPFINKWYVIFRHS